MFKSFLFLLVLFTFSIKKSHAETMRKGFPMTITSKELQDLNKLSAQLSDFSTLKNDENLMPTKHIQLDTRSADLIKALLNQITNQDNDWKPKNMSASYNSANENVKKYYNIEEFMLLESMLEEMHIIQNILHARKDSNSAMRTLSVNNVYHLCDEGLRMLGKTRKKACGYSRPPKFLSIYTCKIEGKSQKMYGYSRAEACGNN